MKQTEQKEVKLKELEEKILELEEKSELTELEEEELSEAISTKDFLELENKREENQTGLRQDILLKLQTYKKSDATEIIANTFLENNYIWTIRNDKENELWIYRDGIYIPEGMTFIREYCREVLLEAYTPQLANIVISKISADTYVDAEDFFSNNLVWEIAVLNGILDIRTKKLKSFTPKKIFFNKLPVFYDKNKDCPNIKHFFSDVLKSECDVPVIQELFGFLLLKEYKYEKGFMFNGTGRNGKGKTLELIKRFLGAENCSSIPLQQLEENEFAISGLFSKMANIAGDLSKTALRNSGRFKEATGRDLISANRKNKSYFSFVNYAKMLFACNELPISYDTSVAFFNRWELFEFPYTFVDKSEYKKARDKNFLKVRNPDIISKLTTQDELSGLLNWSLIGLDRLRKRNEFSSTKTTEETKNMWLRKSSSINGFLQDHIKEDYDSYILKSEFRRFYSEYCRFHKLRVESDKVVLKAIIEFGGWDERFTTGDRERVYAGIKIVQPVQPVQQFSTHIENSNSLVNSKTLDKWDKPDVNVLEVEEEVI